MDSVPFKFCDAVAAILTQSPETTAFSPYSPWKAALDDHRINRKCVNVYFTYSNRSWKYHCVQTPVSGTSEQPLLTFVDVLAMPRKYLRVVSFQFFCGFPLKYEATQGEILEMATLLKNYANESFFIARMASTQTDCLKDVLPCFQAASFQKITLTYGGKCYEDFLRSHLKNDRLIEIEMYNSGWSREFLIEVGTYMLRTNTNHSFVFRRHGKKAMLVY
ncbi:hypothetical protein QR680_008204 [Steinernema hermaphroditum]|uniref:Uncharacterized protein n=1 Tax=Steinernema hermaphroditum TaxID=289476 RepID=A0AA39IFS1_9BILA|nr:hypothetical protein QR680_008204 [Steinernema hermaphroditum]